MKELNLSLQELYSLPESKVSMFIHIMSIESQYSQRSHEAQMTQLHAKKR